MLSQLRDEISWMYLPRRFLFGPRRAGLRVAGWETLAFIEDPEALRRLNAETGKTFFGGQGNGFLGPLMGQDCVFLLDGPRHKQARKILSRSLGTQAIGKRSTEIEAVIAQELERAKGSIDLARLARKITMGIMCQLVLGTQDYGDLRRVLRAYENVTGHSANIVSYKKPFWRSPGPFFVGALAKHLVGRVDHALAPIITEAQRNPDYPACVLKDLVAAQTRGEISEKFLRDNLVGALAAGYDTTACALSWTFYWLAREGEGLQAAIAEDPTAIRDHISAFRTEILRYCPPVEILPRKIDRSALSPELARDVLGSETGNNDATMACPFVHRAHHNPQSFDNPERFDHTRFLAKRPPDQTKYFPFGAGERLCVGIHLGRHAVDTLIGIVLRRSLVVTLRDARFRVVRRNVSIWPGRRTRGSIILKDIQNV